MLIDADDLIKALIVEANKYIDVEDKSNNDFLYNIGKVAGLGIAQGIVESFKDKIAVNQCK